MKIFYIPFTITLFFSLLGCEKVSKEIQSIKNELVYSLPDCSSQEAKDTVLKIMNEKIDSKKTGRWYTEKFEIIETMNKTPELKECYAQLIFSIPSLYQDNTIKKLPVTYNIRNNEIEKNSFSVSLIMNYELLEKFNNYGRSANQNYLFKKANVEYLSEVYLSEIIKKMQENPLAILANSAIIESLSLKLVHLKLLDNGWKFDGESKDNKMTAIYSKEKFTLSINTEIIPAFLSMGPFVEEANIWEK